MAWLHILNGKSVKIQGSMYELESKIRDFINFDFKSVGLKMKITVDSDNDTTSLFLGVDMLPGANIIIGETKTMPVPDLPDGLEEAWADIMKAIHTGVENVEIKNEEEGVVVSIFD